MALCNQELKHSQLNKCVSCCRSVIGRSRDTTGGIKTGDRRLETRGDVLMGCLSVIKAGVTEVLKPVMHHILVPCLASLIPCRRDPQASTSQQRIS